MLSTTNAESPFILSLPSRHIKPARALISVSDKTGLSELAETLVKFKVEILSTGGTAKLLREKGIPVIDVSDYTGFPEMMDGRVKTLHPKVHGGLLHRRDISAHVEQAKAHGILPIDIVIVNLYPFEKTIAKPDVSPDEAVEQIDIGGPSMVRSAAKNWESVAIVTDSRDYPAIISELNESGGGLSMKTRFELARRAFSKTAAYDAAISAYFNRLAADEFPETLVLAMQKGSDLRYGENPHQRAAFYLDAQSCGDCVARAESLDGGKAMSYNNYMDADAAFETVREFDRPAAVVVKHANPCGCAEADSIETAMTDAYEGDPVSAFGSIIAFNRAVSRGIASFLAEPGKFVEAIIAPDFDPDALEILRTKPKWKNSVRLLKTGGCRLASGEPALTYRKINGGMLAMDKDAVRGCKLMADGQPDWTVVTKRAPTADEIKSLLFAQRACKHVKSNAILLAKGTMAVGVGAGQMSRLDSAKIAVEKAGARARGSVMASDAFFPFPDAMLAGVDAGATAVIQPGGSKGDAAVIAAADERGIAMVLTGVRHFLH